MPLILNAPQRVAHLDKLAPQLVAKAKGEVVLPSWARNANRRDGEARGIVLKWVRPRRSPHVREFATTSSSLRLRDGASEQAQELTDYTNHAIELSNSTDDTAKEQRLKRSKFANTNWRRVTGYSSLGMELSRTFQTSKTSRFPESATFLRWLFAGHDAPNNPKFARWIEDRATVDTKFDCAEQVWKCNISFSASGDETPPVTSSGMAKSQHGAEGVARLHLGSILSDSGLLSRILPVTDQNMTARVSAHVDFNGVLLPVYEYAAGFLLIPRVIHEPVPAIFKGNDTILFRVTICLPEHNIKVTALHSQERTAEIGAVTRFRSAARNRPHPQGNGGVERLMSENAAMFLRYFQAQNPTAGLYLSFPTIQDSDGVTIITPQANCWGERLIEPFKFRGTLSQARNAGRMVTAVKLARQYPDLWKAFESLDRDSQGSPVVPMHPLPFTPQISSIFLLRKLLTHVREVGISDSYQALGAEPTSKAKSNMDGIETLPKAAIESCTDDAAARRSRMLRDKRSRTLLNNRAVYRDSPALSSIHKQRDSLPVISHTQEILRHVNSNTFSIILGETGSGKSTQVPQILFDDAIDKGEGGWCNIICTQPRRLAAMSVSQRVAYERGVQVGDSVGWHIRGENREATLPGCINYMTTGILLRRLQHQPENIMDNVSHIILDEVHERSSILDFVLIALKELIKQRQLQGKRTPKVVLMSATLNSSMFSEYFSYSLPDSSIQKVPTLRIPGRTFPVQTLYLESVLDSMINDHGLQSILNSMSGHFWTVDFLRHEFQLLQLKNPSFISPTLLSFLEHPKLQKPQSSAADSILESEAAGERIDKAVALPSYLISLIIAHVTKSMSPGSILVFLPGLKYIDQVTHHLQVERPLDVPFDDSDKYKIIWLHSEVEVEQSVFKPASNGQWRIILATNIAESSITLPDVRYVIDSGLVKSMSSDPIDRYSELKPVWISKSSANQRRGRAGRVQKGHLLTMYSRARFETFDETPLAELLATDLQTTCLDVAASQFNIPVRDFLGKAIEPPSTRRIDDAMLRLMELDAITKNEELTALGRLLSQLYLTPSLGKLAVYGLIFRCLDPLLILASLSMAGFSSLLKFSRDSTEASTAKHWSFAPDGQSDHLVLLKAFRHLQCVVRDSGYKAAQDFATANDLNWTCFEKASVILRYCNEALLDAGLIQTDAEARDVGIEVGGAFFNQNSDKDYLIRSLLLGGMQSNIAVRGARQWSTARQENVSIPVSCIVNKSSPGSFKVYRWREVSRSFRLATFDSVHRSPIFGKFMLQRPTIITPMAACLFSSSLSIKNTSSQPDSDSESDSDWTSDLDSYLTSPDDLDGPAARKFLLTCDKWLTLLPRSEDARAAKIIFETRKLLQRMLVMAYIDLCSGKSMNTSLYQTCTEVFSEVLRFEWETILEEDHVEHITLHKEIAKREYAATTGHQIWDALRGQADNAEEEGPEAFAIQPAPSR